MSWFTDITDRVQAFKAQNEADAKAGNAWYHNVGDKINSAVDTVQEQAGLYADQATQAYDEFQDYRADNKQKLQDGTSMYHQAVNKAKEYADSAVQAVQDAPANIQQYMSAEERALRSAEEDKLNYFQANPEKQGMTDQLLEVVAPLSGVLSKGMVAPKAGLYNRSIHDVNKLYGQNINKGVSLPASTDELQQLAIARKLGQQQTNRQFALDDIERQANIDYGINTARVKAGLGQQRIDMQQVAANTMDPAKVAAEKKYWLDGMAQQKIDSDNYFYN